MKLNKGDICIVYKDTPTYSEGGVVQIIDRDPNDKSYIVAHLQEVGMAKMDTIEILQSYAKWVKEENLQLVSFDKPKERKSWIQSLKVVLSACYANLRTVINRVKKP